MSTLPKAIEATSKLRRQVSHLGGVIEEEEDIPIKPKKTHKLSRKVE